MRKTDIMDWVLDRLAELEAARGPSKPEPKSTGMAREVELDTAAGVRLTAEDQVAFVEEVQSIASVPVKRRARNTAALPENHRARFARTQVVRVRSDKRALGARTQARRDRRGKGRR
jgi:hypothetical protein